MENSTKTPKWLISIQENSWNVELFISIGFIYVFLKLPQITDNFASYIISYYGAIFHFAIMRMIIQLAIVVLPIGFITHLVFRGIWIGLVGFSYVFPDGIKTENLNYSEKYNEVIKQSKDPVKIIVKLEKICSLIYTFTFLFFFVLLAVFNFFLITGLILDQINTHFGYNLLFQIVRVTFFIIGIVYAFDFFTTGLVKRSKFISKMFFPFYKVMSFITIARLYRTQYYTFVTRYNKVKVSVILFSIVIIYFLTFVTLQSKTDRRVLYSNTFHTEYLIEANNVYENYLPEGSVIREACIQSDIVKDNFLKLFITHKRFWEYSLDSEKLVEIETVIDSLERVGSTEQTYQYIMDNYDNLYCVYLDEKRINKIDWFFYKHPKTVAGGIVSYIDISNLGKGHHNVRIKLLDEKQIANIHFWKE